MFIHPIIPIPERSIALLAKKVRQPIASRDPSTFFTNWFSLPFSPLSSCDKVIAWSVSCLSLPRPLSGKDFEAKKSVRSPFRDGWGRALYYSCLSLIRGCAKVISLGFLNAPYYCHWVAAIVKHILQEICLLRDPDLLKYIVKVRSSSVIMIHQSRPRRKRACEVRRQR